MRVSDDGRVMLGFRRETKSMDDYAAYMQALAVKPYLSAREASTYFDIGINRARSVVMSDEMASYRIRRGNCYLVAREAMEQALLAEAAMAK